MKKIAILITFIFGAYFVNAQQVYPFDMQVRGDVQVDSSLKLGSYAVSTSDTALVVDGGVVKYNLLLFDTTFFNLYTDTLEAKSVITNFKTEADTVAGTYSFSWGEENNSESPHSTIFGKGNVAEGFYTFNQGLYCTNDTDATYGFTSGLRAKSTMFGQFSRASGYFANRGDAQTSVMTLRKSADHTTDASFLLSADGFGYTNNNFINALANSSFNFKGWIEGMTQSADQTWSFEIEGAMKRDGSDNTTLVWSAVTPKYVADDDDIYVKLDVDDRAGFEFLEIAIQDTGAVSSGYTIRWVATVILTQVSFP